jgi:hypothetical protein
MTKQEFTNWAKQRGWKEDRFGNLRKEKTDPVSHKIKKFRLKLNKRSVRYEIQHVNYNFPAMGINEYHWIRLRTGFYKNLSLDSKNKIMGFKR